MPQLNVEHMKVAAPCIWLKVYLVTAMLIADELLGVCLACLFIQLTRFLFLPLILVPHLTGRKSLPLLSCQKFEDMNLITDASRLTGKTVIF